MANLCLADRRLARADAVEETPHVIVAGVEGELLGLERLLDQFGAARLELSARHVDPAFGPLELDAVQQLARLELARSRAEDGVGRRADAPVADTAGVRVDDL